MSQRYQRGSVRRESRAGGKDVWVWRYRIKGIMKQETFPAANFKTERDLWKHLEPLLSRLNDGIAEPVPVTVTLGAVIEKYKKDHLSYLAKSTRDVDGSMLDSTIRPKWGDVPVAVIRPMDVDAWLRKLPLASLTKQRAKRIMKQLYDKAMFWEMVPFGPNPMTLVKVKGASKRTKPIVLLTIEQVNRLVEYLHPPYDTMVFVAAGLGLRVSEVMGLKWGDFDFNEKTVTISRVFTHGEVKEMAKTAASEATLPVSDTVLRALPKAGASDAWVFPSPVTDNPYTPSFILTKILKPAAAALGLPKIRWHTFRHSYRAWIGSGPANLSQQKDLMRHADISTTMGYGGTPIEDMRPLNESVASLLDPTGISTPPATIQ